VFHFLVVTVAGYEFCGYWLRTLIVEKINEEERLSHVSTPETNSWTVICDTFKALSFLITYSEEDCTVSEVFLNFSLTHYRLYSAILLWVKVMPGKIKCLAKGMGKTACGITYLFHLSDFFYTRFYLEINISWVIPLWWIQKLALLVEDRGKCM